MNAQELEIKVHISNRYALVNRLKSLGACLVQARVHETNIRFDTPAGELSRTFQVLRLRQDTEAHLTYKGPGQTVGGVRARQEIEFTVSDFAAARALLETLGYKISVIYEKYRTTYELDGVLITLDELPYGFFAEIEGADAESIRAMAARLDVDWEARILDSYIALFEKLRGALGFTFRDLTFANFAGMTILPTALGVQSADNRLCIALRDRQAPADN